MIALQLFLDVQEFGRQAKQVRSSLATCLRLLHAVQARTDV